MCCGPRRDIAYPGKDKNTEEVVIVKLRDYLSKKQRRIAATKPDIMWQFAQRLKQEYAEKGQDVGVFIDSRISVNGRKYSQFTDKTVDVAAQPWETFKHTSWILPSKLD